MTRLPVVSDKEVAMVLKKAGFIYAPKRGKGSHVAFFKEENNRKLLVIVPKRKQIPRGTLTEILKQADLDRDEFMDLLKAL